MRGVSNKLNPHLDMQAIYRGTLNAFCAIDAEAMDQDNFASVDQKANKTLTVNTPKGLLQGSVAGISADGTLVKATPTVPAVGLVFRNSAGEAWESTNSAASGGVTYIHGSTSVVEVPVFETQVAGTPAVAISYAPGDKLYASVNGLLTNAAGLGAGATPGDVVGILLAGPVETGRNTLTVQMRI